MFLIQLMHKDMEKYSSTKLLHGICNIISHTQKSCGRKFIQGLQSLVMVSVLHNLPYYHMKKFINYITPQNKDLTQKLNTNQLVRGKFQYITVSLHHQKCKTFSISIFSPHTLQLINSRSSLCSAEVKLCDSIFILVFSSI